MANHVNIRSGLDKLLIDRNILSTQSSILYLEIYDPEIMSLTLLVKIDTIPDIVNFLQSEYLNPIMKNTFEPRSILIDDKDHLPTLFSGNEYTVTDKKIIFDMNFLLIYKVIV
ncbi:MAG: hypothetical protein JXB24_03760 [Bacteroidales bacterium]|nr:hypothetical protein [Bacteroidales bacterium]